MMRCPNGTTSAAGATSIYDCVLAVDSSVDDVLLRVSPFNDSHPYLRRAQAQDAPGRRLDLLVPGGVMRKQYPQRALKFLQPYFTLRGWDVATITIDLRGLSLNITYYDHWRFGIYENCQPCPTRYACDYSHTEPTCGVSYEDQQVYGVNCTECCACRRMTMPAYFEQYSTKTSAVRSNNVAVFPYLDNKHKVLQFTITALLDVDFVFTLELVHGLFVRDFKFNFLNTADIR
jgi:hypothetical protein